MRDTVSVTLWHKAGYDAEARTDRWEAHIYLGCHWFGRRAAGMADGGQNAQNSCTVRIFTDADICAEAGDVLVQGARSEETPAEAEAAGAVRYTVTSVTDNRRGSRRMRHWKLEGA